MTTLSVADARAQFSRIVESAQSTHERFEVTRNGDRVAVLLGADDFDALLETVEILGDAETMADIRAGLIELRRGDTYSVDEVREQLRSLGRLGG